MKTGKFIISKNIVRVLTVAKDKEGDRWRVLEQDFYSGDCLRKVSRGMFRCFKSELGAEKELESRLKKLKKYWTA